MARHYDLPLRGDPSSRFLPWLVAFMVYLAVLAGAGGLALEGMVERWQAGATNTLTVQVEASGAEATDTQRRRDVLRILRDIPGIAAAEPLPPEKIAALLEPWLGTSDVVASLPLPIIVDVTLDENARVDLAALAAELRAVIPDVTVDDHSVWLQRLIDLTRSLELVAAAVLVLIAVATVGTVVFATRAGLAMHHNVIEVLHLIGAHDSYIARQFGWHATMLGLRGGLIGFGLAVPTVLGIGMFSARLEQTLLAGLAVAPWQWAVLAVVPVAAAVIARLTARATVYRTLRRMI